jgi:hypothetical protein
MTDQPDFSGRVVSVWCKDPAQGAFLQDVTIKSLHYRSFIVGKVADEGKAENDPRIAATYWFPVDDIIMLTVYPDLHTARAAYAAREKQSTGSDQKKRGV